MFKNLHYPASHIVLWCSLLTAAVTRAQPPEDADERRERLQYMQRTLTEFQLFGENQPDKPFPITEAPLLRWSNPVRNFFSDGALFLWVDGSRPVAAATMSIRGEGRVWREFTSLTSRPLRCRRPEAEIWSPRGESLTFADLPEAPGPAASASLRLVQMRRQSERFTFHLRKGDQTEELRRLPQPLYRYSDEKAGIMDGALIAFVETTDAEALLILEAFQPAATQEPAWRFAIARMTSLPVAAQFDGREIWSVAGYWSNPRTPQDGYVEAFIENYPIQTTP